MEDDEGDSVAEDALHAVKDEFEEAKEGVTKGRGGTETAAAKGTGREEDEEKV